MDYYRDSLSGLSLANANAFPATSVRPTADWRDGCLDTAATAPTARADLDYYMNTSNIGDPGALIHQTMTGAHYGNILYGVVAYLNRVLQEPVAVGQAAGRP